MSIKSRLTEVFRHSPEILFDDASRYLLLSDCHRGIGDAADDFLCNKDIFESTLTGYFKRGFTYIEVGDGDELWKNGRFEEIYAAYTDIFHVMQKYHEGEKLYLVIGNHDSQKADPQIMCHVSDENPRKSLPLFDGIKTHEGLVLKHTPTGKKILIVHGHQGDLFNDALWPIGWTLVHLPPWNLFVRWRLAERISPAKNEEGRKPLVKGYREWAADNGHILICGHIHQANSPEDGEPPYWNTGCWDNEDRITGIVIENSTLSLMKWDKGLGTPEVLKRVSIA